jgi:hypothetical protein
MLTAREIAKELGEDVVAVRAVLSSINQAAILEVEKAKVSVEVWDGTSDIQGIPAAHWRSNGELPAGGHMYLLREVSTGIVLRAQPFAPQGIGRTPMSQEQAISFGTAHRDEAAAAGARQAIIKAVDLALDAQA